MTAEKMDRRVRKTRALLLHGLITLMEQKDSTPKSPQEMADFCTKLLDQGLTERQR